jgi:hypothetical protein
MDEKTEKDCGKARNATVAEGTEGWDSSYEEEWE